MAPQSLFWRLWALEVMIVGGYDTWRLWYWGLRTFPKTPVFWRFWSLDVSILEVMNFGGCDLGVNGRSQRLLFWRFWSLDVSVLEVMSFGGCDLGVYGRSQRLLFLEVLIVGCFNFGGYELWRLWCWSFWWFPHNKASNKNGWAAHL